MSDINFSFDGPKHAALDVTALQEAITAEAGAEGQEAASTATPKPQTATSDVITPTLDAKVDGQEAQEQAAVPQQTQQEELRTHKIVVDGQELEVTEADLKAGHMRQRDYTQKTQALAAEKQRIDAERSSWAQEKQAIAGELAQIDQFLRDQNAIKAYAEKAFGISALSATPPPQIDPNKPLTAMDVAQISAYNAEQVRLSMQRELVEARQQALKAQQLIQAQSDNAKRASTSADLDSHIKALLDKHPVLRKVSETIDEELIGDAVRFKPRSLEEAKTRLSEAAERRVAALQSITGDEKKQSAVKAAQLKRSGTEQPGGTAPKPAQARNLTFKPGDRKDLLAAAEADLRALMGQ